MVVTPSKFRTPAVAVEVFFTLTIGTCNSLGNLTTEGTIGFYITFPDHSGEVNSFTLRHALFLDIEHEDMRNRCRNFGQLDSSVVLPGDRILKNLMERALEVAEDQRLTRDVYQRELNALGENDCNVD
jgi:hypothetical protein